MSKVDELAKLLEEDIRRVMTSQPVSVDLLSKALAAAIDERQQPLEKRIAWLESRPTPKICQVCGGSGLATNGNDDCMYCAGTGQQGN